MDGKQVGWQIVNSEGWSIHGDPDDPFELNSFDILVDDAVEIAKAWAAQHPGYKVVPVMDGDIEEPEFVSQISLSPASAL
jgi:hypothetical protein